MPMYLNIYLIIIVTITVSGILAAIIAGIISYKHTKKKMESGEYNVYVQEKLKSEPDFLNLEELKLCNLPQHLTVEAPKY